MKILAIIASPHKNGNTDTLVSKILKGAASAGATINLSTNKADKVYLDDLRLIPCKACFKCRNTGKCVLKDKLEFVIRKIENSDLIIFGSPVYCETVTAQAKILIDRIDSSQVIVKTVNNKTTLKRRERWNKYSKKGVIVCVADLSPINEIKQTASVIKRFFGDLNIKLVDEILVRGLNKPGTARNNPTLLNSAFKLGLKLAQSRKVK